MICLRYNRFFAYALAVVFALICAPYAQAKNACDMAKPTQINIIPQTSEVTYDYTRSLSNIQAAQIDTVDPYGVHSGSITQGFMEGQISMTREVQMDYDVLSFGRGVCLWYKTINVTLHIDPKIVIAKEVKSDRCMYKAVLEHEMKHVDADRKVVNAAAQKLGKVLYDRLSEAGFVKGPVPAKQAQAVMEDMQRHVMNLTQEEYEALSLSRAAYQGTIDTREEYERVRAQCPDYLKHKEILYKNALKEKLRHQ